MTEQIDGPGLVDVRRHRGPTVAEQPDRHGPARPPDRPARGSTNPAKVPIATGWDIELGGPLRAHAWKYVLVMGAVAVAGYLALPGDDRS